MMAYPTPIYKTIKEAADALAARTKTLAVVKPRRKMVPVRIELDGKIIVTESGKCVWACEGHAKSAFQGHISDIISSWEIEEKTEGRNALRTVYEYLVESGRVQFVPAVAEEE
jgi:hypothetical protein